MNFGPYLGGIESWSPNIGALVLWTVVGVIHTLGPPTRPHWPRPVTAWSLSLTESSFFATSDWDLFFFRAFFFEAGSASSRCTRRPVSAPAGPLSERAQRIKKNTSPGDGVQTISVPQPLVPSCRRAPVTHPTHRVLFIFQFFQFSS